MTDEQLEALRNAGWQPVTTLDGLRFTRPGDPGLHTEEEALAELDDDEGERRDD